MTIIVDTGPLLALADRRDERQALTQTFLEQTTEHLVVPAPITAETDYMLETRVSPRSARLFLEDLAAGVFEVACLEPHEYQTALDFDARYQDLRLGLADLSIVVLARRYQTRRVLTFDTRHFAAVEPLQGGRFELLPA